MRYASRGEAIWVAFDAPAEDLVGTFGVAVVTPLGAVVVPRRTTGITAAGPGILTAQVTVPTTDGTYLVVGDDGSATPEGTTAELVIVTATGVPPEESSGDDLPEWAPTLALIASVVPQYTRGSFDDDEVHAGAEQGTFTERTQPTADGVTGLIFVACDEIEGRVGVEIPERCFKLARSCAIWHVAANISASKIPAETDDARAEYRAHTAKYLSSLEELIDQARQPWAMRLA